MATVEQRVINNMYYLHHQIMIHKHLCDQLSTAIDFGLTSESICTVYAVLFLTRKEPSYLSTLPAGDLELPKRNIKCPSGSAEAKPEQADLHTQRGKSQVPGQVGPTHRRLPHAHFNTSQIHLSIMSTI